MGREYRAQSHYMGSLNLRFSRPPNDALIDNKVRSELRMTVISQRLFWRVQIRDANLGNGCESVDHAENIGGYLPLLIVMQ